MSEHSWFAFPWFGDVAFPSAVSMFSPGPCIPRDPASLTLGSKRASPSPSFRAGPTRDSGLRNQADVAPTGATVGAGTQCPRKGCLPSQPGHDPLDVVVVPGCTHTDTFSCIAFTPSAFSSHSSVPGSVLRTQEFNQACSGEACMKGRRVTYRS